MIYSQFQKYWGQCKLFPDRLERLSKFGLGGYAVFRKAWFLPLYYAGTAAERQILQKKSGENSCKIVVSPARPLKQLPGYVRKPQRDNIFLLLDIGRTNE